jgi:tRNA A37 methylthiotransferase MiaB
MSQALNARYLSGLRRRSRLVRGTGQKLLVARSGLFRGLATSQEQNRRRSLDDDVRGLDYFIKDARRQDELPESVAGGGMMNGKLQSRPEDVFGSDGPPSYHIETYGCQMNVSDSEIVSSILEGAGFTHSAKIEDADVILTNTCAIRENAEQKVRNRVDFYGHLKSKASGGRPPVVGVLGCMAERLKTTLLEEHKAVDIVVGPDAYRDLPSLVSLVRGGHAAGAVSVQLSAEETYADVTPVRRSTGRPDAFVSVMRGCNNLCSFCIVPFTRGRERSRSVASIVEECKRLSADGVREIVLLGQNVNSYHDKTTPSSLHWQGVSTELHSGGAEAAGESAGTDAAGIAALEAEAVAIAAETGAEMSAEGYLTAPGFGNTFKSRGGDGARFAELLEAVAAAVPETRVRFTSPHPKDFPLPLLQLVADTPNLCSSLHLPAQSGSSSVLRRMRRHYTREAFLSLVDRARSTIPGVSISTDLISGFCGETEEEHADTLSLIREAAFDQAFMFHYSERARTLAARSMEDDVPEDVKLRRLREVIDTFMQVQTAAAHSQIGRKHLVLVEGAARRSPGEVAMQGRTDCNRRVVLPAHVLPVSQRLGGTNPTSALELAQAVEHGTIELGPLFSNDAPAHSQALQPGTFVEVDVVAVSGKTLIGIPTQITALSQYERA